MKKLILLTFLIFISHQTHTTIQQDLKIDDLYTSINYTNTKAGAHTLKNILYNPTDNLATLTKRQTVIRYLDSNKKIQKQLTKDLLHYSHYENIIERFSDRSALLTLNDLHEFYFSSTGYCKTLNASPFYLNLGHIAYYANLLSSVVQHALLFAIVKYGLKKDAPCCEAHAHTHKKKDSHCHNHSCSDNHHHDHDHKPHAHETHHHEGTHKEPHNAFQSFITSSTFDTIFNGWHTIAQFQEIYAIQAITRSNVRRIKHTQTELIKLAAAVTKIKNIYALIHNISAITGNITGYQDLKNICTSTNISPQLKRLLTLLEQPTFTGKASLFSHIGNILAAAHLAKEVGHELQPALIALGEIDAYLSCSYLLSVSKESPQRYSCANYRIDSAVPMFSAENFWHPLLTTKKIQGNCLSLGTDKNSRNIIITAPNAAGKSTALNSALLCAYLAQTIGIVPAEKHQQTVYKEIYSSVIIQDNIAENLSLFATELSNAENLIKKVNSLAKNEYMLIALDELFRSTQYKKGESLAYKLLTILCSCPNVIVIVSTHFEGLIKLAETPHLSCENYTVNNFILEPGIGNTDNTFTIIGKDVSNSLLHSLS